MHKIDLIILSNAKTPLLERLTINTIESCESSNIDGQCLFNYIVIEQNETVHYNTNKTKTVRLNEPFNYNRFMNYGMQFCTGDYIAFCNNDLDFSYYWGTEIINAMFNHKVLSASPYCKNSHKGIKTPITFGYEIRKQIAGWCIVVDKKIFETIGKLNEDFEFWYCDNAYAEQLKANNLKHILVKNSVCAHITGGQNTLNTLSQKEKLQLTWAIQPRFEQQYPGAK